MVVFEIAAYIFFIVFAVFVSTRVLWLIFFLFCYRFWEAILSYSFLSTYIPFAQMRDYYITIVIIALATYVLVSYLTRGVQHLRYLILVLMILYTIKAQDFEISNILLFKDYLEAKGMWDLVYWKDQFKELASFSVEDLLSLFQHTWDKFFAGVTRFFTYIKNLI